MEQDIISIKDVYYSFEKIEIIKGISLDIIKGESLVIFGQSGSGKSTLLKLCAGICSPTKGQVFINGVDIYKLKRKKKLEMMSSKIGFVFQDGGLISNINIYDNLSLTLKYHNMYSEKEISSMVQEKLKVFGLEEIGSQFPASLSPGQRKLASLARGTINQAEILFLDEPTTSVDSYVIRMIIELINKHVEQGKTVVTITQNQEFSEAIASRIAVIDDGQLVACDNPDTIKSSENPIITRVMKSLNVDKELADEFLKIMMDDDFFD